MISNFSKIVIDNGGRILPLLIDPTPTNGTGLTNPSIFINNDKVLVNLRHVQYTLYHGENEHKYQNALGGPLIYLHPEDDLTLRTVNYLCELDPNTLEITSTSKVDTSKLDKEPLWEFIGLEDARVVKWDNKLYLSGVRRDTTTDGEGRMELSEIVDGKEISRVRIEPPTPTYCEKNWMPILDMPYHYVKWTNPTEVVKVDIEKSTSETVFLGTEVLDLPRDIRGGSQVIPYKEYRIALTHEVDLYNTEKGSKNAQYYHRFIVWDKDWNIIRISEDFKFMTGMVEFSCGMVINGDSFLITYGFQDNTPYILEGSLSFLDKFLSI